MTAHAILAIVLGALAGFAFHRLVGCRSGACAIYSGRTRASLYGALLGFMIGGGA